MNKVLSEQETNELHRILNKLNGQDESKNSGRLGDLLRRAAAMVDAPRSTRTKTARPPRIHFDQYLSRKVALEVLYFGWDYDGLAMQIHNETTIEAMLFQALKKSCLIHDEAQLQDVGFSRCGRTDKGVSAYRQVVSLTIRSRARKQANEGGEASTADETTPLPSLPAPRDEMDYVSSINRFLPPTIKVTGWMDVPDSFDARYNCVYREYTYYFLQDGSFNLQRMAAAASHLVGDHDFRNLCKVNEDNVNSLMRRIQTADILPVEAAATPAQAEGGGQGGARYQVPLPVYMLRIRGSGFLYHQIRCIMSILIMVGRGYEEPSIVQSLLDVDQWSGGKPAFDLAAPEPLVLSDCGYDYRSREERRVDRYGADGGQEAMSDAANHAAPSSASLATTRMRTPSNFPLPQCPGKIINSLRSLRDDFYLKTVTIDQAIKHMEQRYTAEYSEHGAMVATGASESIAASHRPPFSVQGKKHVALATRLREMPVLQRREMFAAKRKRDRGEEDEEGGEGGGGDD